ncbi:MAG: ABC transporter substrate-binding protein [Chloroflexi bacterium]|nr:ABC transporter substrate-binding protein [Chloroflexota bacterium]
MSGTSLRKRHVLRRLGTTLLLGVVAALLAACSAGAPPPSGTTPVDESPKRGGTLKVALPYDLTQYDPLSGSAATLVQLKNAVWAGLIGTDQQDRSKIANQLAASWEFNSDKTAMSFKLRPNLQWHDGKPLTADDVVYSLLRYNAPPKGASTGRGACARGAMKSVRAVDAQTVEITLPAPSNSFLACLSSGFIMMMPKHIVEPIDQGTYRDLDPEREMIGSGPFKVKAHTTDSTWELVRNDSYFLEGRPYLDGVTEYIMPDATARIAALRTGQVHILPTFPSLTPSEADDLKRSLGDQVRVEEYYSPGIGRHTYNILRPPFNDPKLRQAVELAIDRWEMIDVIGQGKGKVSHPFDYQPWIMPYEEWIQKPGYRKDKTQDLAEARRLIKEGGWEGLNVTFTYRTVADYPDRAQLLVDQLTKIGLKVTLRAMESRAGSDAMNKGDYEFGTVDSNEAFGDPGAFTSVYVAPSNNVSSGWQTTPEYKQAAELWKQQDQEFDLNKRGAILRQVVDLMMRAGWIGWNYRLATFAAWRSELRGYTTPNNQNSQDMWDQVWLAQ